jgi:hypothetical protein
MKRNATHRSRPTVDTLEPRQLLDANSADTPTVDPSIAEIAVQQAETDIKVFKYTTPERTHVTIRLDGVGTLAGTSVRPDGSLDLVYDNTNRQTQIFSQVSGRVPPKLATLRDADVSFSSLSGIGGNLLGLVALKPFRLVDGGHINLTAGVRKLKIKSIGANSQVQLRTLPVNETALAAAEAARALNFLRDQLFGEQLVFVDGSFVPVDFVPVGDDINLGSTPPPNGIKIVIDEVKGNPANLGNPASIGDPQIYGYDAAAGLLLRIDGTTGAVLQSLAVPTLDPTNAGVSLGQNGSQLVVLIGQASTIRAFDALTLAPAGQFSTANISGFSSIDALAKTDTRVAMVDAVAGGPGSAQMVDVTASLKTGQAVPIGTTFQPTRDLDFTSAASGIAGFESFGATNLAFYDSFQPMTMLPGLSEMTTTNNRLAEQQRVQVNAIPNVPGPGNLAMGSIDGNLAVITSTADGVNTATLLNPDTESTQGILNIQYAGVIAGLSESFRPDLVGTALVDVQGDIQAFQTNRANGLVLNDSGVLNLLGLLRASNSVVYGFPVVHLKTQSRDNVTVLSDMRPLVGTRGGVTVNRNLKPVGPLFIP